MRRPNKKRKKERGRRERERREKERRSREESERERKREKGERKTEEGERKRKEGERKREEGERKNVFPLPHPTLPLLSMRQLLRLANLGSAIHFPSHSPSSSWGIANYWQTGVHWRDECIVNVNALSLNQK